VAVCILSPASAGAWHCTNIEGGNHMAQLAMSSDKTTFAGLAFLAVSIVIGMAVGGADTFSLTAGIVGLVLVGAMYLIGRYPSRRTASSCKHFARLC
jgi:hypothetical protein